MKGTSWQMNCIHCLDPSALGITILMQYYFGMDDGTGLNPFRIRRGHGDLLRLLYPNCRLTV